MKKYLFFDLDGTLTDSAEGIVNAVIYALGKKGITEPDRNKLLKFVGPPLWDSFERLYGMNKEEADQSVKDFRELYLVDGWKQNAVYEGIPEALEALRQAGYHLAVATAKPEVTAKKVLDLFDLTQYFEYIGGSSLDGTITSKDQVITYVLDMLRPEHREDVVMVGDRFNDVEGARANGISCVGVLYGYGSREELTEAGADAICPDVRSLPEVCAKILPLD